LTYVDVADVPVLHPEDMTEDVASVGIYEENVSIQPSPRASIRRELGARA